MSGFAKKKKMTEDKLTPQKNLYVVDVVSTFRMRYVVEAKEEGHALDEVAIRESDTEFKEFSQEHIGTHIFSSREISKKEYLELFDKDNDYLKTWSKSQKFEFINEIDYEEDSSNGK